MASDHEVVVPQHKLCSKCGEEKPTSEFYARKASLDGLQSKCKPCSRKTAMEYHWGNHERVKARMRSNYRRNRSRCIERAHRQRAYGFFDWDTCLSIYGYQCAKCGDEDCLTVDHITPVSKGGTNWQHNIQPLCGPCNRSKRTGIDL